MGTTWDKVGQGGTRWDSFVKPRDSLFLFFYFFTFLFFHFFIFLKFYFLFLLFCFLFIYLFIFLFIYFLLLDFIFTLLTPLMGLRYEILKTTATFMMVSEIVFPNPKQQYENISNEYMLTFRF